MPERDRDETAAAAPAAATSLVIRRTSDQIASRRLASHTRGRRVVSSPLSLSGASPRASVLSSLSPAPHRAPPCWSYSVSHSSAPVVCFSPRPSLPHSWSRHRLWSYTCLSLSCCLIPVYIYIYLRTLNHASVGLGSYSDGRLQSGAPSHTRVRADDEPDTRPTIGEEGSALWLTTTKRRTSRTLLPKASRASASPATPISKHVFFFRSDGLTSIVEKSNCSIGTGLSFSDCCKLVTLYTRLSV